MLFNELKLNSEILKAIEDKGYEKASPIQEKAIPVILERRDVLASAQTGTGKTAGFTLPILELLSQNAFSKSKNPKALILTPTRELAAQIYDNIKEYSKYLNIRSTVIFGGVNQKPQVARIKQGLDILVATPGRLIDLQNQRLISLKEVKMFVLDEADRMLDMGFQRDLNKIMSLLPTKRQNLLFSATFSKEIKGLANNLLTNPVTIEVTPENSTVDSITQKVNLVNQKQKTGLVIKLISDGNWSQVLIFTRTKHGANRLTKNLIAKGITAAAIHGNKSQGARTKALANFKSGDIRVMVATDIAARGLDIPLLPHVINFELPNVSEDYVHRIGRTGRAGASGIALSLVCSEELAYLRGIEKLIGKKIEKNTVEGFEYDESIPKKKPNNQNNRRGGNQSQNKSGSSNKNNSRSSSSRRNSKNSSSSSSSRRSNSGQRRTNTNR